MSTTAILPPTTLPVAVDSTHELLSAYVGAAVVTASSQVTRSASTETLVGGLQFERKMGDSELSYYLPSRANGTNDMYLHLGFSATEMMMERKRVLAVWSILRVRHPLLAAKVVMRDYDDVRFVYEVPTSVDEAMDWADEALEFNTRSKDELLHNYLNGPRTLSNERISYLIISQPDATTPTQYELLMCAAHFLGDGMALHTFANDFLTLLASGQSQADLETLLSLEWQTRCSKLKLDKDVSMTSVLPTALEANLTRPEGKFRRAVAKVDFNNSQEELIGGQGLPRTKGPRRTVVPTESFDAELTKKMLKLCKSRGVSISAALFAICNLSWARISNKPELPMLMYSALNLRPYFTVKPVNDSYWYLAVGYFNVILPTFLPKGDEATVSTFWHRARLAKEQSTKAAKNTMVVSRNLEMAAERGRRARAWAKEDDDKEAGIVSPPTTPLLTSEPPRRAPAPSTALIGLSLLGNLDGMYKHASFPEIQLHTLTTGSRQREGGMLLFGYTFVGKLFVSLGYDVNGFEQETVVRFWKGVMSGIEEMLGA